LKKKGNSEALNERIFQLAETIIQNHCRSQDAKPLDPFTAKDL
jgi:hypothetical protein